jgi:uncharacterized protein involved in exopolysaccharide biosynthesis
VENAFDLLEQRVRRAADALRRLQGENADLKEQLHRARSALERAEKALQAAEKHKGAPGAEEARRAESLAHELETLRREREEVRSRLGRLLEALDGLD